MIEKMKQVCVVASESSKTSMLEEIRKLGVLHIAEKNCANAEVTDRFAELSKVQLVLSEYPESGYNKPALSQEDFENLHSTVVQAIDKRKFLNQEKNRCSMLADSIKQWGNFEPSDINALKDSGIELHMYRMGKKEYATLAQDPDIKFITLASVDKMQTVAVVGNSLDKNYPATEFAIPEQSYDSLCAQVEHYNKELAECEDVLKSASTHLASYKKQIIKCKNDVSFSSIERTASSEQGLVWLGGYIPESDETLFKENAKSNGWAYIITEPAEDNQEVPTKVKYSKLTSLMKPVFDILGTVPGYHEYDISFWFLCFFTLFFAMIIGDGGYGLIFLACAVGLHIKTKKPSDVVLLLYVLSIANIAWGAVTGTWFGLEGAMSVPFLKKLVIPAIANYPEIFGVDATVAQNNIMKFCFILGTIQLSLACIISIKTKIQNKNLSFLADVGWLVAINALYYVVLLLVIGVQINTMLSFICVGIGFVLVVVFGGMSPDKSFAEGLKAGLGNAFTTFLNTISAFGNVMSYIRLFAVGMASLAIAQSFNNMAGGFTGILKIAGIIIFVIGHVLNLVMGLLSVVVHGVRLNLLEFSGQLGMEWSGIAYEPFSEIKK